MGLQTGLTLPSLTFRGKCDTTFTESMWWTCITHLVRAWRTKGNTRYAIPPRVTLTDVEIIISAAIADESDADLAVGVEGDGGETPTYPDEIGTGAVKKTWECMESL